MKKRLVLAAVLLCVLTLFSCAFIPASADGSMKSAAPVAEKILSARFLNMLNRNFVYNEDFASADIIVEASVLALLDLREENAPDYIADTVVIGFVKDMYGIELADINDNSNAHKDGFVYIAPRGFTSYSHTVTDIKENEDGSFTVLSAVTVTPHDDAEYSTTAETLFVKNEKSAFGYNIIYSNIKGEENLI